MARRYDIGLHVNSTSDDRALRQSTEQLDRLDNAGSRVSGKMSGWARSALAWAAGLAVVQQTLSFLRSSFGAFIEGEQALKRYDEAAKAFTGARTRELASLHAWIEAFEKASGVSKEQALPAFTNLLTATKDLGATFDLMELAAGFASRGMGTLETNAQDLAMVLSGRALVGASGMKNALREAYAATGDWGGAIEQLVAGPLADAGVGMDDLQIRLDRAKMAWENSKEAIGGTGAVLASAFAPAMKVGAYAIATVAAGLIKLVGVFAAGVAAVKAWGRAIKALATLDLATIKQANEDIGTAFTSTLAEYNAKAQTVLDDVVGAWDQHVGKIEERAQRLADTVNNARALAKGAKGAQGADGAAPGTVGGGNEDAATGDATGPADAYYDHLAQLDQTWTDVGAENQARREELARIAYGNMVQAADDAAEQERQIQAALGRDLKGMWTGQVEDYLALLQQLLQSDQLTADQRVALEQQAADARAFIEQTLSDQKREMTLNMLADMFGALSQAFDGNKAFAIAEAIINTYVGITKALELPWPMNLIAAVTVAARGFAAVKKIKETKVGSGGSGGGSASVSGGGGSGASVNVPRAANDLRGSQSVSNVSNTTVSSPSVVNVKALTVAEGMRELIELERKRSRAYREHRRAAISDQVTTVGRPRR